MSYMALGAGWAGKLRWDAGGEAERDATRCVHVVRVQCVAVSCLCVWGEAFIHLRAVFKGR